MDVIVYCADVYCVDCGDAIKQDLTGSALDDGDSNVYPQGPFPASEADTPQHCGSCGTFLENPLTGDGYDYVKNIAADWLRKEGYKEERAPEHLILWWDFYYMADDYGESFLAAKKRQKESKQ